MSNDQFKMPDTECLLFNTGAVSCVPVIKYISKCHVDYTYWPHDQQKCRIAFGSWTYTGEEIDFYLDGNGVCELYLIYCVCRTLQLTLPSLSHIYFLLFNYYFLNVT